jgi:hypothetical protein
MAENIENIPLYEIKSNVKIQENISEMENLIKKKKELLELPQIYKTQKEKLEEDLSKIKNPNSHNYLVKSQQLRMLNLELDNLHSLMTEIPEIEKKIDNLHDYIQEIPNTYRVIDNLEKTQLNRGSKLSNLNFSSKRNFGGKKKSRKQMRKKRSRTYKRK